jgi:PPOX class probable FMN-dependent enzyme
MTERVMVERSWRTLLERDLDEAGEPNHGRLVQLATLDDRGHPVCRTLVFRLFLTGDRLLFTTDLRTPKVSQLARDPRAEACWYFRQSRRQYRIRGLAEVSADPVDPELIGARQRTWVERQEASRRSFLWPTPGQPLGSEPYPDGPAPAEPPANFALLTLTPLAVDFLDTQVTPHERRLFARTAEGWTSTAVHP